MRSQEEIKADKKSLTVSDIQAEAEYQIISTRMLEFEKLPSSSANLFHKRANNPAGRKGSLRQENSRCLSLHYQKQPAFKLARDRC